MIENQKDAFIYSLFEQGRRLMIKQRKVNWSSPN